MSNPFCPSDPAFKQNAAAAVAVIALVGAGVYQARDNFDFTFWQAEPAVQEVVEHADEAPHWGYHGDAGPAHWGGLAPQFAACAEGQAQSPVDLAAASVGEPIDFELNVLPAPLSVLNNGHTVQFNMDNGSTLTAEGVTYNLLQVHFHTPSEHVAKGKPFNAEAHFVHQAEDGSLAVVGVLVKEGKANPTLASLFEHLPAEEAEAQTFADTTIDANGLIPADSGLFHYSGSLTTPPCSEGVNWYVFTRPATASAKQLATLSGVLGANARPAQALNERAVEISQ
ncbi:carbonic anhydrase [Roseospirillum parvum]|uniref:carbonic anhydrase n=1 Tax=Roseospirillum parvum TaxID=83401 RepID=A0A1G8A0F2_9PROT|nr:carbonic anhydrase family protein [Roseospirillum parvum]SDH13900.1 carbonic anhydrase [Roseospirillum parvum]